MIKNIVLIIVLLLNVFISYGITTIFNIKNAVLFQPLTSMNYTLTYEVIIWFILTIFEYIVYKYIIYIISKFKSR